MERANNLKNWIKLKLNNQNFELEPIAADAGFRRYFRIRLQNNKTLVAMDASSPHEDCRPFLKVADMMAEAGLRVPEVISSDLKNGFLILTDLGKNTYLDIINENNADALFKKAIFALIKWQCATENNALPLYSEHLLRRELNLFKDWYLNKHLNLKIDQKSSMMLRDLDEILIKNAKQQAQVFVHRDFMPRNIMADNDCPGIIDFQDAVIGPVTYDLVSLFRDAFLSWNENKIDNWIQFYWESAKTKNIPVDGSFSNFKKQFNLMGVHRHLKILGIFARICYRDKKTKYLEDTPRFFNYLNTICNYYSELLPLNEFLYKIRDRETAMKR